VRGASVVVSAVHGFAGPGRVSPATVDRAGNGHLIDIAAAAGADVVMMSLVGAAPDSTIDLFRAKHDAERHLRAGTTPWTIIRATSFVELWAELVSKGVVFGRGENPINFVAVDDVAALVETAVTDDRLRGQLVEIGGPGDLPFNELGAICRDLTGRPRTIRHVPRPVLRLAATFARQPRLALAMDTEDMTFDRSRSGVEVGPTQARDALAAAGTRLT
jgi:NADH dehydrogenase